MLLPILRRATWVVCMCSVTLFLSLNDLSDAADITIDGTKNFQTMNGFGVNANSERWNNGELIPALDTLIDTMGATVWRVVVESHRNWETTNDNADPFTFSWTFYNSLYETPKFRNLWGILGHLKQKNVDHIMVSIMGCLPSWMGGCSLNSSSEDEWVELAVSLLYYARNTKKLRIDAFDPFNEPDISNEGPSMGVSQYIRVLKKLIARMDALGLGDIKIVGPSLANPALGRDTWMPAMLADSQIMGKVQHFGYHSYSGSSSGVDSVVRASAYPDRNFWMTEFSAWCSGCDTGSQPPDDWTFGSDTFDYLYNHINQGAASALIWEGYDSYYEHHNSWSYWGLLSYNDSSGVYTPRKRMYINAHVFKYVRPGAVRISISTSQTGLTLLAFSNPITKRITIVGENWNSSSLTINGTLIGLSPVTLLELYQTSQATDFDRGADVPVIGNKFSVRVNGNSFFTLTGASESDGIPAENLTEYTIWPSTAEPGIVDSGPDSPVELGVKFQSDIAGAVTGIRFYKANTNTGTHVGNLWSNTGTLLATSTFANETASGWQEVSFPTPVPISANTVYVASYHTNVGCYSDDHDYFASKGVDSPPLHALADGVSGFNGVYRYSSTSAFPNQGWRSSNYWVDLVFKSTAAFPDSTPPTAPADLTAVAGGPTQVNLNWAASTDNVGVAGYLIIRNGRQIGTSGTTGYSDITVAAFTVYKYTVRAYDAAGNVSGNSNIAAMIIPTTVALAPVLDKAVTTKQASDSISISSPSISTAQPNELLAAFIASDGPNTGGSQRITAVTGGGLTWTLRARANAQAGTAEIWTAPAPNVLSNMIVTATRAIGSYQGMMTVASFKGASLSVNGAAASASASTGAPQATLTTTQANSLVWAVGDDWDRAVARTVSDNQTKQSEYLAPAGDTFWVQYITAPSAAAGVTATTSCTAPTNDRWNLAVIEILPQ